MKVLITGESGFIATNLAIAFKSFGHEVVYVNDSNVAKLQSTGEMCVHRNSAEVWAWHLKNLGVDVVVHNAAVVGTDVVALNPQEATLSNVAGSYNLAMASKSANVPICYMGTTVIYDTAKYQSDRITEASDVRPMTFYGSQKLAGEQIVTSHSKDWLVMRPLFAYGGAGDMNSLIAKTIYAHLKNKSIDMFLNPSRIKDYLHVQDFCDAVVYGCVQGMWGNDFNISAETPHVTLKIVEMLAEVLGTNSAGQVITWHPETDYLGNHMLSSEKFRRLTSWEPKISLRHGIRKVYDSILRCDDGYNPLVHLDRAKKEGVDLTEFYNSNI